MPTTVAFAGRTQRRRALPTGRFGLLVTCLTVAVVAYGQSVPPTRLVSSGAFGFNIPDEWKLLPEKEQEELNTAFEKQEQSLFKSYSNTSSPPPVSRQDVQGFRTPSGSVFLAVGLTVSKEDNLMEHRLKEAHDKAK